MANVEEIAVGILHAITGLGYEEKQRQDLLKKRIISINCEIGDWVVDDVIVPILKINEEDKDIEPEKRKPITLYINSPGGDVQNGLMLCDIIESSKTPVHGITLAYASSMASIISLACHKRLGYRFSTWLLHDGFCSVQSSSKKARQTMEFFARLDDKIMDYVLKRTSIPRELYEEKAADEWWIDSEEALKYGIIDEVIGVK